MDWSRACVHDALVVYGHGQRVCWKGSYVTVLSEDGDYQRQLCDYKDGEGVVPEGTTLFMVMGKSHHIPAKSDKAKPKKSA